MTSAFSVYDYTRTTYSKQTPSICNIYNPPFWYLITDSMVLAGVAQLRPGGARKIPAVRHRNVKGTAPRFRGAWGHERHAKVPNPSRRPVHGAIAVRAHLVSDRKTFTLLPTLTGCVRNWLICFDFGFSFNQLDLPVYKTFDKLRACLLKAIHECSEGFGFA